LSQDDVEPQLDKVHPNTLALEVLATATENADPAIHEPNPGLDDVLPIVDFGAQHPDHELGAGHRHGEDLVSVHDDAASLSDTGNEEVVGNIPNVENVAVIEHTRTHILLL